MRWLAFALLAAGVGLLATARFAVASPTKDGEIFRYGIAGASVQVDPQIAYITTAWWLEYATAAMLYNYPDRRGTAGAILRPEAASRFTVSNYGRTYTFTIRKGFRFSDGTPVTAKSFAYAIDRVANHDLGSPGANFITDQNGTEIVGAQRVVNGEAQHVSGVKVKGRELIIHLLKPDPWFLTKLTMPFFQATSTTLPLTHEVDGPYPSAGPYAFTANQVNVMTSIRRNPYWTRGPGRLRPRHLDGLDVLWNQDPDALFSAVQANQVDEDGAIPKSDVQGIADQYGVNKSRFWVKPTSCIGLLLVNSNNGLFKGNVALRKAVNWAVDRTDYAAQAGPYAATPWTHLLPLGFPGSVSAKRLQPYSTRSRISKARRLARGHFRGGKITVYYLSSGEVWPAQAQIVHRDLVRLGFEPGKITMKGFSGADIYPAILNQGSDADLGVSLGWCADFSAPAETFSFYVGYYNVFGIRNMTYQRRLEAASRLTGRARYAALGKLDLDVTRNLAPAAAMQTYNNRYFFSDRVDPTSLVYEAVYQDWSIPALALR